MMIWGNEKQRQGEVVRKVLTRDMTLRLQQLMRPLLDRLSGECAPADVKSDQHSADSSNDIILGVLEVIQSVERDLAEMEVRHAEFQRRYALASTPAERKNRIFEYLLVLGSRGVRLAFDRMALSRSLDYDAVIDRYMNGYTREEQYLSFTLERLGILVQHSLQHIGDAEVQQDSWHRWDIESVAFPLLNYKGDIRVRISAFRCLSSSLQGMPMSAQEGSVKPESLQRIFRAAMDEREQTWIQCEALVLLQSVSVTSLKTVIERRLSKPGKGDDLFVRRRAVTVLGDNIDRLPELSDLFPLVARDPSPFVRQGFAHALTLSADEDIEIWLHHLATQDEAAQVRAVAIRESCTLLERESMLEFVICVLDDSLSMETDKFVLRTALQSVADGHELLVRCERTPASERWREILLPRLQAVIENAEATAARRWAAIAMQRLWVARDPGRLQIMDLLAKLIEPLRPGDKVICRDKSLCGADDEELAGILSSIAQKDFGFEMARRDGKISIRRGDQFIFRWWRAIHEWRKPAPDKRQAHSHTIGRLFRESIQVPSSLLGELTHTRVPGEPFNISNEGDWRPHLPLPDLVLSSLFQIRSRCVRIFTPSGTTRITPPSGVSHRFRAWCALTWRFEKYAELRNWQEGGGASPSVYVDALNQLGIKVEFESTLNEDRQLRVGDDSVTRFFPALIPIHMRGTLDDFTDYFVSIYGNKLHELAVFMMLAGLYFVGQHIYRSTKMRWARRAIPLVIGGWGTRGKSGTERLKAGILNAMGSSVFSKTTGCEAMFLYSPPFGKVSELYIFRPFDKATIWEQTFVVRLAAALRSDVFLWECMALNPRYVRIMQTQWMQDDISTITNAYPDHEDLQGPAGYDIPHVMNQFIPDNGHVLTTEDLMLPILHAGARERGARMQEVDWYDAGILTPDILDRFPYAEHPNNIALVVAIAAELGVSADFALKEMADRVVPDIGVLKAYPAAAIGTKRLEFINGMSANERFACLANWERMGFADQDPVSEPGVWLTALVNNRADRVSRSKMFAGILVGDIAPDRYYMIGSNVNGLAGYMEEAWIGVASDITLWPDQKDSEKPEAVLDAIFKRFRLPVNESQLALELGIMAKALEIDDAEDFVSQKDEPERLRKLMASNGVHADDSGRVLERLEELDRALNDYRALSEAVSEYSQDTRSEEIDERVRGTIWKWMQTRFVLFGDPHISGEAILAGVHRTTPPGFLNRIMGMQNIKGAGLEFVYCWEAWDACHRECRKIESSDPSKIEEGIKALIISPPRGTLSLDGTQHAIEGARSSAAAQKQSIQSQLGIVENRLRMSIVDQGEEADEPKDKANPLLDKFCDALEALLDAGDSVRRAHGSRRIYRDLINERISLDRATSELRAITKRQKGGWLKPSLFKRWRAR